MGEHDVEREEGCIREGKGDPERLAAELDVREDVDAGDGEHEGERIPGIAHAQRCEQDHRQELDRRDRSQREAVDRDVEAGVHQGEHDAEADQQPARRPVERPLRVRQGLRQAAKTIPALTIRNHATPSGSTRTKRRTANAGPR